VSAGEASSGKLSGKLSKWLEQWLNEAASLLVLVYTRKHNVIENLYFTRMIYPDPVAKQTENNKLTNSTININSQHIQHDEVGNRETIQSKTIFADVNVNLSILNCRK